MGCLAIISFVVGFLLLVRALAVNEGYDNFIYALIPLVLGCVATVLWSILDKREKALLVQTGTAPKQEAPQPIGARFPSPPCPYCNSPNPPEATACYTCHALIPAHAQAQEEDEQEQQLPPRRKWTPDE